MTQTIERPRLAIPAIEDITRREFLIGGAGLLALGIAGCGGEGGAPSEMRTVESAMGPVELPTRPQRLLPGYTTEMDYALVLGIPMAAATGATGGANQPFAGYQPEEELEGLEKVQVYPEANYEQIAAVEPDCILDQVSATDPDRYERLSEIAPTFAFQDFDDVEGLEYGRPNWRRSLRTVGKGLGRAKEADEFIEGYKERVSGLRERLAKRWSDTTFAVLLPYAPNLLVRGKEANQASQILFQDLALNPASVVVADDKNLSIEAIPEVDADVILLALAAREDSLERDQEVAAPILDSSLWQRLPAVETGQVYKFDQELAYTGPLTARAFLDVVEKSLLG